MHRKLLKQLIYGTFYMVLWLAIGYGIYASAFRPAPTCFDNRKNQTEEDVDCGGTCVSCAVKNLAPIEAGRVSVIPGPNGSAVLLAEFRNKNASHGAQSFKYRINFIRGTSTVESISGDSIIYPSQIKYVMQAGLNWEMLGGLETDVEFFEPKWVERTVFSQPEIQMREVSIVPVEGGEYVISGTVKNVNAYALKRLDIIARLSDDIEVVGISRTIVEDLEPNGERHFQLIAPIWKQGVVLREPELFTEGFK